MSSSLNRGTGTFIIGTKGIGKKQKQKHEDGPDESMLEKIYGNNKYR